VSLNLLAFYTPSFGSRMALLLSLANTLADLVAVRKTVAAACLAGWTEEPRQQLVERFHDGAVVPCHAPDRSWQERLSLPWDQFAGRQHPSSKGAAAKNDVDDVRNGGRDSNHLHR
jgi:hypothetical protein